MQGYSPTFNVNPKTEFSTKVKSSFIELGVKNVEHKEDCKCSECITEQNT